MQITEPFSFLRVKSGLGQYVELTAQVTQGPKKIRWRVLYLVWDRQDKQYEKHGLTYSAYDTAMDRFEWAVSRMVKTSEAAP